MTAGGCGLSRLPKGDRTSRNLQRMSLLLRQKRLRLSAQLQHPRCREDEDCRDREPE
ncbi:hypothetical protein [Microcoleus sp. LEGE 07076]|uniref:hypothetical protein n=1 Tax=Microcoleus sp. LEGE 07076 TaxID=915322 RepID=UPI001D13D61E|nr:hypothetical protein [Microcoleus sp. LEGE 07076]